MPKLIKNIPWLLCLILAFFLIDIAQAQPVHGRIAVYMSRDAAPYTDTLKGFKQYLNQKNWQGTYVAHPSNQRLEVDTWDFDNHNQPDLILTLGESALEIAAKEYPNTPIVAGLVLEEENIRNNSKATGIYLQFSAETQLQWLQRLIPDAYSIGVLYDPSLNKKFIDKAYLAARQLHLEISGQEIIQPQEIPAALKKIERNANVLWGVPDKTVLAPQTAKEILLFSYRNRIPLVGLSEAWVKAGALYALDRDYQDIGTQCGEMALEILQGTSPDSIPATAPRKIQYFINAKTAQHMKIILPSEILEKAKKIY